MSLAAHINSFKMNTLPKLLYLFQCVPLFLPQSFFSRLNTAISEFIWNKKTPRIRKQFLQRPRALGGMALPNLRFYYWASNIRIIQSYLRFDSYNSPPVWFKLEAESCKPVPLSALAHSPIKSPSSSYTTNVIIKTSLRIWNQFRCCFGLQTYST